MTLCDRLGVARRCLHRFRDRAGWAMKPALQQQCLRSNKEMLPVQPGTNPASAITTVKTIWIASRSHEWRAGFAP